MINTWAVDSFFKFIYLFCVCERERERERESFYGRGRERGRERIPSRPFTISTETYTRLDHKIQKIMT